MLDSRDNSVLKSLKELRKQEEERVKKERAEAEARTEAERKAKEDTERRAKEAAEKAKREEEERQRRVQEQKEAQEREGRLRVEEAERRARIEAETKLQQERMRLEAQAKTAAKAAKNFPMGAIVGIVVAVAVVAGGIIFKIKSDHAKQLRDQQAQQEKISREAEKVSLRLLEEQKKFEQMEANFKRQIAAAKNDAERAAIQKQLDDARRTRAPSSPPKTATASKDKDKKETAAPSAPPKLIKDKKEVSLDPLEGLKL